MTIVTDEDSAKPHAAPGNEGIEKALAVLKQVTAENAHLHEELFRLAKREEELLRRVIQLETSLLKHEAQKNRWQNSKLMRLQRSYWQILQKLNGKPNSSKGTNE